MSAALDVLCAGIIVADHVCTPIDHVPVAGELVLADGMILTSGGCAANAAVDLVKMGHSAAVAGRVGEDLFGRIVRQMLTDEGVQTDYILATQNRDTSQTLIVNVQDQDRRFIHTFGANAAFRAADIPLALVRQAKIIYVGGYLLMPELDQAGLVEVFRSARQAGTQTVLDVAVPNPGDYLAHLRDLLPWTDLFLPNDDEAKLMLGMGDPQEQALRFQGLGAQTVVITQGERGAVLVQGQERLRAGIFEVDYVDGSGSGDAFDAGFMIGMLRGEDARGCLTLASALGASCVRAIGTTPGVFTASQCADFLQEHELRITNW
jgi:sugar/nucleoside kinase (ribokinase family)